MSELTSRTIVGTSTHMILDNQRGIPPPHAHAHSRAYGKLPNFIVRNAEVSPALLVLIGYRLTFTGDYGLSEQQICNGAIGRRGNPIASRGLSRDTFRRAMSEGQALGLLDRRQQAKHGTRFGYARDRVIVPPGTNSYKHVRRQWFDGRLSVGALAAFLFIRAGTGKGPFTYAREVAQRFGWSRPTAAAAIDELLHARMIQREARRNDSGRFDGVCYGAVRLAPPSSSAALSAGRSADPLSTGPATGFTGDGHDGGTLKNITHKNIPQHKLQKNPQHTIQKSYASPGGDACSDFCLLAAFEFERCSIESEAFASPNLLGWLFEELHKGHPAQQGFADIEIAAVDEILAAVSAATLTNDLRAATGRRLSAELLRPSGLYAVCHLAAGVRRWDNALTPAEGLGVVLAAIAERIGSRGGWLNSLSVIAQWLAGARSQSLDAGQTVASSRKQAKPYIAELQAADGGKVLAARLFEDDLGHLGRLLLEYGEGAVATIRAILTRYMIDEKPTGSITTWAYFKPALDQERLAKEMADEGMRPGDVLGGHRRWLAEG
jgi:hypothetical protein